MLWTVADKVELYHIFKKKKSNSIQWWFMFVDSNWYCNKNERNSCNKNERKCKPRYHGIGTLTSSYLWGNITILTQCEFFFELCGAIRDCKYTPHAVTTYFKIYFAWMQRTTLSSDCQASAGPPRCGMFAGESDRKPPPTGTHADR